MQLFMANVGFHCNLLPRNRESTSLINFEFQEPWYLLTLLYHYLWFVKGTRFNFLCRQFSVLSHYSFNDKFQINYFVFITWMRKTSAKYPYSTTLDLNLNFTNYVFLLFTFIVLLFHCQIYFFPPCFYFFYFCESFTGIYFYTHVYTHSDLHLELIWFCLWVNYIIQSIFYFSLSSLFFTFPACTLIVVSSFKIFMLK